MLQNKSQGNSMFYTIGVLSVIFPKQEKGLLLSAVIIDIKVKIGSFLQWDCWRIRSNASRSREKRGAAIEL